MQVAAWLSTAACVRLQGTAKPGRQAYTCAARFTV
jgi:hypothetical protein